MSSFLGKRFKLNTKTKESVKKGQELEKEHGGGMKQQHAVKSRLEDIGRMVMKMRLEGDEKIYENNQ